MLNNLKILIGLLVVISGFAYWVINNQSINENNTQQPLLPEWQNDESIITAIDEVVISHKGESLVITKIADQWQIKDGFYASLEPLSNLLQGLKDAVIIESKTANPANHQQIELADNDLKVTLHSGGNMQQSLHIGKQTSAGLTFVRKAGENQTYTAQGLPSVSSHADTWSLKTVLDYAPSEILAVTITPADSDEMAIIKNLETGQWDLTDLPVGKQLKTDSKLESLAGGISRLMIDGASPVGLTEQKLQSTILYHTRNNDEILIKVYQQDDQYFIHIDSAQYPHYKNWLMQIAAYKYEAFNRHLDEFIEPVVQSEQPEKSADEAVE